MELQVTSMAKSANQLRTLEDWPADIVQANSRRGKSGESPEQRRGEKAGPLSMTSKQVQSLTRRSTQPSLENRKEADERQSTQPKKGEGMMISPADDHNAVIFDMNQLNSLASKGPHKARVEHLGEEPRRQQSESSDLNAERNPPTYIGLTKYDANSDHFAVSGHPVDLEDIQLAERLKASAGRSLMIGQDKHQIPQTGEATKSFGPEPNCPESAPTVALVGPPAFNSVFLTGYDQAYSSGPPSEMGGMQMVQMAQMQHWFGMSQPPELMTQMQHLMTQPNTEDPFAEADHSQMLQQSKVLGPMNPFTDSGTSKSSSFFNLF